MQQVSSDVLQFRGSHYEFGVYQGQQLLKTKYLENRVAMHNNLNKKFAVDVDQVTRLFQQFAKQLLEEIYGLADTLAMDLPQAFVQFGGYYGNIRSGCSIMMGEDYFIRNYDNEPTTYDGRYVLFQPTDGGLATVGPTMQVTGRMDGMDGMNGHGLVMGYNFVNTRQHEDGFVCNMIGRIVLETCATTAEAIFLLERLPHKHSFNYCLFDAAGHTSIVEASPRKVIARDGIACTNHFQALTEENRYTMADTLQREHIISQAAAQSPDLWAGYHPASLTATITLGAHTAPMPFHFGDWLAGHPLYVTKIKGQLDAKTNFANY